MSELKQPHCSRAPFKLSQALRSCSAEVLLQEGWTGNKRDTVELQLRSRRWWILAALEVEKQAHMLSTAYLQIKFQRSHGQNMPVNKQNCISTYYRRIANLPPSNARSGNCERVWKQLLRLYRNHAFPSSKCWECPRMLQKSLLLACKLADEQACTQSPEDYLSVFHKDLDQDMQEVYTFLNERSKPSWSWTKQRFCKISKLQFPLSCNQE